MDEYVGSWELIPELCIYERGEPPLDARYRIAVTGDATTVSIQWTDRAGNENDLEFGGPADGSRLATDAPGATHVTITRVDERTLDSAVYNGSELLMYARRRALEDLLSTVQTVHSDGGHFSNFQVYRRHRD